MGYTENKISRLCSLRDKKSAGTIKMFITENYNKEGEGFHIKSVINKELQRIEKLEKQIKINSQITDSQKLSCRKVRGNYQYLINNTYVSKIEDDEKIRKLAKEEYQRDLLPLLEKEIKYLKLIQKTETQIEEVYNNTYEGKRVLFAPDIKPVNSIIEQFENETYEGLGFDENDPTDYITNRGERVRSKSEKIIADELDRQGIPYKYEKPLLLSVDGKTKNFYPDFTVLNVSSGEIKYMEHLGMVDHPNYYKNTLAKLDVYERNGLLVGRDIILLHESSYRPLSTRAVSDYIFEFLK